MIEQLKRIIPARSKKWLRSLIHTYTCPFCDHSFDELSPIGLDHPVLREKQVVGGGRRKGGCPNCGSTDRERLIYAYLSGELKVFQWKGQERILHIAPEKPVSRQLLAHGFYEYVCGDLFTEGYIYPKHVRNMNVMEIPYEDGHFDLVICNHVLEHIPTDQRAMQEIRRVLKVGGQAILQVPISKTSPHTFEDPSITGRQEREAAFGQFDHVRIYGQDYPERLARSGFKVERRNISRKYRKYGSNPEEDLFICVKTA